MRMRNVLNLKGYNVYGNRVRKIAPSSGDESEALTYISHSGWPPEVIILILIRQINLRDVNIALTQRRLCSGYSNEHIHMWFGYAGLKKKKKEVSFYIIP